MPPLDLPVAVPLAVSVLSLLGIGSLLGQWAAGGKDRRTARADVLAKLGEVESVRWWEDGPATDGLRLVAAIRALETAALLARVPRAAVIPYAQLATAGLWMMQDDVEAQGDSEWVGLNTEINGAIGDAAEVLSRAAWSPAATRWLWLRWSIGAARRRVEKIENRRFQTKLSQARRDVR